MKRAIALFLALVFVFGLIPVSALADDTVTLTIKWQATDTTGFLSREVTVAGAVNLVQSAPSLTQTVKEITLTADKYDANGALFTGWDVAGAAKSNGSTYEVENGAVNLEIPVTASYGQRVEVSLVNAKFTTSGIEGKTYHAFEGGDAINIAADTAPTGQTFKGWAINPSTNGASYLGLASLPTTNTIDGTATFLSNKGGKVTISAVYSNKSYSASFNTSGNAIALGTQINDDFNVESPLTVSAGSKVYVRVAANTEQDDRKVTGCYYYTVAEDGTKGAPVSLGTPVETAGGFSTYLLDMPESDIVIYASYKYKVTLYGSTFKDKGALVAETKDGNTAYWGTPGTEYTVVVNEDDIYKRTIVGWTFAPDLVADDKAEVSKEAVTDPEYRKATFTMPSEPLAITIRYDRALAENSITVVNGYAVAKTTSSEMKTLTPTDKVQEGEAVTVTAAEEDDLIEKGIIPEGYAFKNWVITGDDAFVNSEQIKALTLTKEDLKFAMPKGSGTLTAVYVGKYELTTDGAASYTVPDSTGTGKTTDGDASKVSVAYNENVTVTAKANETNFIFDRWIYTKAGVSVVPNATETAANGTTPAKTVFAMPASGTESGGSLTVTAKYKYLLTLTDGTASGISPTVAGETKYWVAPGETVTIVSSIPPVATSDKVFKQWLNSDNSETGGDVELLANKTLSTTTFTMPARTVTLKATDADAISATILASNVGQVGSVGITGYSETRVSAKAAAGVSMTATVDNTVSSGGKTFAFDKWESSIDLMTDGGTKPADMKSRTLVFDMPTADVTLTPKYTNEYATVTVNGGTGSGTYPKGTDVTITANDVAGKEFLYWEFTYTPVGEKKAIKIQVVGSPYTFKMGEDVALASVTAKAIYTQLYSLTLQNAQASAASDIKMTRPATTVAPIIPEKTVSSAVGETSISAYWKPGDVISIETPATVTIDETEYSFTNWRIISGKGTLADATSAKTTFTMTTSNVVLAAQYGGNMLIYKTEERDNVHLYDNWSYASYNEGDLVQLTAKDPDKSFVRWASEPEDLIRDADKGNLTITFNMPAGSAKIWPEYAHKMNLVDGEYSLDGGTTWTLGGGVDVRIPTGDTVRIRPIEDKVGSGTTGKRLFKSWRDNTTRISSATAEQSFTMPPEDLELSVIYQTYTLTVYRTVNGSAETYALHPGEYITLTSEEASGGRCFNYWTHTDGLTFTVNDEKIDEKDSSRLVSQRITVQMPAKDAFIHAWYELYPRYDYWNTDAFIRVEGEPKRYYARLEYFQPWGMKVLYYAGLTGTAVEVDPTDYVMQIVKAGTNEVATTSDFCFTQEGAFDIIVTMIVNGRQMAPAIRVMDQPSTHLYCTAIRAEFVQSFTKPARTVYFEGEEVDKDGLDVLLRSADHTSGAVRYSTVRELDESEYKLKPWGTGWDADGHTNMKLPSIVEIQKNIDDGKFGYKLENGRYYVCMEVTDCFDYTQLNSDGSYMRMEYIVNDATDYIWVEVRKPLQNISLEAIKGDNTNDVVLNMPGTTLPTIPTYPFVSWEISNDLATAQSGIRKLKVNADGYTDAKDLAAAMEYVNSDPNVAYLEPTSDPLVWNVKIKSTGVTTITFRALGNKDICATCEITVNTNLAVQPIAIMPTNGLNKSAANLYVGTKLTLYPVTYTPSSANTTCNWYVSFTDGLAPQNASYYVSVSEAGVVEVLKYTDRPVRIWAFPAYPVGANMFDATTNTPSTNSIYAYCDINVLQIPVDNMTLYPSETTMYRLATKSLKVTLYPEAASDKNIRWTSTDSSVASVDNNGNVTANKLGTAKITATSESNPLIYQTCTVKVEQSVLLTGLTLNRTSATLGIEDTMVLTPYYTPSTATTQSVTWTSNATTVATVDQNGKVRGLSEGVAVITATANDGTGKQVSCVVSVSTIVSSAVVLNKQTLALVEDDTETLVATVYPTNVSNAKVNWTSSNENVAIVDPDGVVTATGGGSAVITATAKDASTKYADCVVAVTPKIPVTSLTLNLGNFDMLLNDTTILKATVAPTNATYKLAWSSSNTAVASVDENGKISALSTGDAVITCKAGDRTVAIKVSVVTKTFSTGKVVNCTRRVNVRAKASGTSTILGYAYLGDVYKVLDKSTNWYKIQYNAGTVAYIWSRYLSATETGAGYVSAGKVGSTTTDTTGTTGTTGTATPIPVVTAKSLTITNCTYCVNVRSGAGTTFSRLGYAYLDEAFTYTGTQGDWYIITYNGAPAYVSSQFVKVN